MAAAGILVIGAGGHAKVVVAALLELGETVAAIQDVDPETWGRRILDQLVVDPATVPVSAQTQAILAIGDNAIRRRLSAELPCRWRTVVHPGAYVHASARVEEGAFVGAGAVVQPDARIGAHAIVNTGATVDHDVVLGPFSHVAPGANLAGHVVVGAGALVGIGASVAPSVKIGDWAVLGAGAVAVRDIADRVTAVGVPARVDHHD